ncbi:MAG: crotonase/enoyl-CoA hydratase family protein [Deltaproteobacteria bacterium]|nr:crotonase/enoyl-CoA hydratase family protein [Deltaproteobacteria bacterium]
MSFVKGETVDGIRVLRLDHGKPNAISTDVARTLIAELAQAEKDAKAIALFGRPGMFSGGFDLGVMKQGAGPAREMVKTGGQLIAAILDHPRPVVVGCTGHAIAMGVFLVMAADYRIGARGAFKLGLNETAIGMTLPAFAIETTRLRLSKRHFARAVVQSEIYDPETAVDAGFLDRLAEPEALEGEVLAVARRLGELEPRAFRNNKRLAHGEVAERIRATLDANLDGLMKG